MRWIVFLALSLRLFAETSGTFNQVRPSTPDEIVSLNSDLLIEGFVSVASGQLSIMENDLQIKGAQDLSLYRTYLPPQILGRYDNNGGKDRLALLDILRQFYGRWSVLPHLEAGNNPNSPYLQVRDPQGSVLAFQIEGNRGYLKTSTYGCSNLRRGEPSAEGDIRNTELWIEGGQLKVIWPNGIQRIYQAEGSRYLLDHELLPNGKVIRYTYNNNRLTHITSTDLSDKHTYATIYQIGHEHYKGSDSKEIKLFYDYFNFEAEYKRQKGSCKFPILAKVSNPSYSNTIGYNERTLLSSYDAKKYPISCTYWQQKGSLCRVHHFSTPSGTTSFTYDPPIGGQKEGSTTVTHPNGSQSIYRFNLNFLLSAIENWFEGRLYNQKLFFYDNKQHIAKIETKDGQGNVLLAKIYECDSAGNPISEQWKGDFGTFSIQRLFSKNRVVKEEYSDGLGFEYTYLEDTRLLTSKTVLSEDKPIRKTQYFYDEAKNLIEEAEIGKTITTYLLYQEGTHLHRPEWKIEKDWKEALIHKTHFTYDQFGNLSEEAHYGSDGSFAYRATKTYDNAGNLLEETNPLGQTASYQYDARGRQIREVPFSQNLVIQRTFDDKGRLTTLQEGDHTSRFIYNSSDELIQKTDYLGLQTHYRYHPIHGKSTQIEEEPTLLEIVYDDLGREIAKKDAYGATTFITPNSYGDPLTITHPDGGQETFRYAPNRTLLSITDPDQVTTSYTYDPLKRILSKTMGARTTAYTYDAYHLLEEKDPSGHSIYYEYNLTGQKIKEKRGPRVLQFSYDSLGFLSKKENDSRYTSYQNDVLGRIITQSIDGQLNTSYTYDLAGNIASITKQDTTRFFYDPHNRLIETIEPNGAKTTISYQEEEKRLTKIIQDPKGAQRIETYNAQGLILKKEIPDCLLEEYSYDKALRLASHDHITFAYTPEGFKSSLTEAGQRTTSWTYTPAGKIQTKIKPDGAQLRYEYTAEGDLARVGSREFQYDSLGRLIRANGFSREYDLFDNVIQEKFATGLILKTVYDDSDRPIERILPDESRILYEYNGPFLTKINRLDTNNHLLYHHTYDQFDLGGHVLSETGFFTTTYQYDQTGRQISQTCPYFTEDLSYDMAGNLIQKGNHSYTYDAANQLTFSAEQFSLDYDLHYNRIARNKNRLEVDKLNQIEDFSYDANGNLILSGFAFDEFDQLIQASGEMITYDALGRRLQKGGITYLYFGEEEVGAFEREKVKELKISGIATPVAVEIDSQPYYPVVDVQGTIRMLIDPTTSKIYKENLCDPFGVGLKGEIPYAYTGKRYDAPTGLVYFGKRYYIPSFGRWLTQDPIGPLDHSNLYQYLFNNPYRFQDPTGESIGGYLLGLGEIILGGTIMLAGLGLEAVTVGGFTVCFGITEITGGTLIAHGLTMTSQHAQDLKAPTICWKNTNPFEGPVDGEIFVGDAQGNIIPVPNGHQLEGTKDGKWIQVKDKDKKETGTRKDDGHWPGPKHKDDPRSWNPHAHVPGVTNPDGTPWLPIN